MTHIIFGLTGEKRIYIAEKRVVDEGVIIYNNVYRIYPVFKFFHSLSFYYHSKTYGFYQIE